MNARLFSRLALIALAVAVILTAVWGIPALGQRATRVSPREVAPRGALAADEQATINLFEKARGSVVYITTQERVVDLYTRNQFNIPRGSGSGFVWDDNGHIVTNFHVVSGASAARVRLSDGRDVAARPVGASPDHDLAVIRVEVSKPPPALPIGASHDLKVGQKTFAIGNPFGLDWTLTTGIISALDRSLPSEDRQTVIEHLIQTDAAINPGNSGGPLLDSAGRLIGVNTAIFSPSGASAGVGFAVPVDTVNRVVPQLIARGKYVRPVLGINVDEDANRVLMRRMNAEGVMVLGVTSGGPAAGAGLRPARIQQDGSVIPGDIILEVDGHDVDSVARLLARLDDHEAGETVRLTVLRDGKKVELQAKLQAGAR